jgi:hypothetical protein
MAQSINVTWESEDLKLERTTFETSRAGEYFDSRQLSTLTGVAPQQFTSVILKESIDNALDACEMAGVPPEIDIEVRDEQGAIYLTVLDNGPGIPFEVVRKVLDYNVRVSDKAAYRSPTRGAQGNALKAIIGIPYALDSREPVIVRARGVRHEIAPSVDPAGHVHFDYSSSPEVTEGTTVSLVIPDLNLSSGETTQDFDAPHWMRSFAAFNPHATLCYQANEGAGHLLVGRRKLRPRRGRQVQGSLKEWDRPLRPLPAPRICHSLPSSRGSTDLWLRRKCHYSRYSACGKETRGSQPEPVRSSRTHPAKHEGSGRLDKGSSSEHRESPGKRHYLIKR